MRAICILLIVAACAAAKKSEPEAVAAPCPVQWTVTGKTASFDWPSCPNMTHFGGQGDAFDALRGKHAVLLGNSVTRHAVSALHSLLSRPAKAAAVVDVAVGAGALPNAESPIWVAHGAASAEFSREKLVSDDCVRSQKRTKDGKDAARAALNCCVAHRRPTNASAMITYAFTNSPSEPALHDLLRLWADPGDYGDKGSVCEEGFFPDYVVLCLTEARAPESFRFLFKRIRQLQAARPKLMDTTTFFLVTVPHRARSDEQRLRRHEADVLRYGAGVPNTVIVPTTAGSIDGVAAGALSHPEKKNAYHFADLGRFYIADLLLNAFRDADAALAAVKAARKREPKKKTTRRTTTTAPRTADVEPRWLTPAPTDGRPATAFERWRARVQGLKAAT